MKRFFALLLLMIIFNSTAQEFADKNHYLIDSLELDSLHVYDRQLLDSFIVEYHKEESDTAKIKQLLKYLDLNNEYQLEEKYTEHIFQLIKRSEKKGIKNSRKFLGDYYERKAYLDNSSNELQNKYLDSAIQIHQEFENNKGAAYVMINKAMNYTQNGDFGQAIDLCNKALKIQEKINDTIGQMQTHYVIAGPRSYLGEITKAFQSHRKSLRLAEMIGDEKIKGMNFTAMARLHLETDTDYYLDSAKFYIKKAIQINEKINAQNSLAYNGYILAEILYDQGHLDEAAIYLIKGNEYYKTEGDLSGILINNFFLTEIYNDQKKYDEAVNFGQKTLKLAKELDFSHELNEITMLLARIYIAKGDAANAIKYLDQSLVYRKDYYNDENKRKLIEQEIEYDYEKQKEIDDLKHAQEIELSEAENKQKLIFIIALTVIALLIAIFLIFVFNRLKLIRKQKVNLDEAYELLEQSKKNELAVSNLKALQSQMNPHFIFNALNAVQDLVLLKDVRNSNKYLGRFSDLIRKILLSSKHQFISLQEEIEILGLYLDLEKLRFEDDFNVHFSCDISESKQDSIQLPAMFIQPYIENAIKHGLFSKKGEKNLTVAFSMQDENILKCLVEDDGVGQKVAAELKEKRLHLHTGFSTEAINQRILLLNQTLDKKIELEVEDLYENNMPAGTRIVLLFPV